MTDKTLEDAIKLACDAHRGQTDKGGAPYILHPLRVMEAVSGTERQITAILHDVVEDGGIELALIRHWFGSCVADAVDCLSRRNGESYDLFITRCGTNALALDVKLADLDDNMNLSRIPNPTDADMRRMIRYSNARSRLSLLGTMFAQGTEARRAETLGSVHDGPVA